MSIAVKVGQSTYEISCQSSEEKRLKKLADNLNKKVNSLAPHFDDGDEKKLLVMASLLIQEELSGDQTPENAASENDVYDAVSETMENVTDYIKKFTNRINNY